MNKLYRLRSLKRQEKNYLLTLMGISIIFILLIVHLAGQFYLTINTLLLYPQATKDLSASVEQLSDLTITRSDIALTKYEFFGFNNDVNSAAINTSFNLQGIEYTGLGHSQARAIISSDDKEGALYKAGDKLSSSTYIRSITPTTVMLINNGKLEKLSLSWDKPDNNDNSFAAIIPDTAQLKKIDTKHILSLKMIHGLGEQMGPRGKGMRHTISR